MRKVWLYQFISLKNLFVYLFIILLMYYYSYIIKLLIYAFIFLVIYYLFIYLFNDLPKYALFRSDLNPLTS